jgi:hypothetical protein
MSELRSRIEVAKLARELGAEQAELAYLAASGPEEIRELRRLTREALAGRHEARVRVLATVSAHMPVGVVAKIAEHAMGAALSARVAGVMEPEAAARLAGHLSPDFLTELAAELDPGRVGPIVAQLPDEVVLDVGRRLLHSGELITLARLFGLVDADLALQVATEASGSELLQVVLYSDDDAAVGGLLARLPEATLTGLVGAAERPDERAVVVALLEPLGPKTVERLIGTLPQ